ncbi:HNH endonuclease [Rhizobium leguminosarum bv. viciae]|uniref:HNH endonuclease n=2 Tax=Rhizobium leguminosarum TaxID=384 RepID=A0A6P0DBI9_RHILE|nr:HNH endonuclease [Rhizobium leguminosarum bv. viciae]MBY5468716.1 HNH endonuclease [Rhizobium leguminosarum]OOO43793.1 hypothetical protein BS629_26765 [Rhizobium leguminosarum bv. viciae USDA 2370]MBY5476555.1 HNH endonuclease [Rhizobium leguminosarum]MBY5483374.1 HNH endonuclease [Rhizobium leguminosarum]
MRSLVMRKQNYYLDGRCVFCRKAFTQAELTDEHIIPEAINGSLVIRYGSCKECATRSNQEYENQALNVDLKVPRLLLGLRGKSKGSGPRDARHMPEVFAGNSVMGEEGKRLDFPIEDYPKHFSLVQFSQAGLLVGIDRGATLVDPRLAFFSLGGNGLENVRTRVPFINGPFAMMIAKIGYCYAMAEYGDDYFDATDIRALLMGTRDDVYNFVGNAENPERLSTRHLHGLYFRRRAEWLTVLVHLFASCHSQQGTNICNPYEVVVGRAL